MKKVALVLGSGGARGLTQIGVIEELEERGYEITSISGCSMGAVIGGVYAAGKLPDFKEWISNLGKYKVFNLMDFTLTSQGFIKGDRVFEEIKKFVDEVKIENLNIPFCAVAVDMNSGEQVKYTSGDLFKAMRASVSIPSVLTPVKTNGHFLVDGGVMNPLPLDLVKRKKGDVLVAVDLNAKNTDKKLLKKSDSESEKKEANKWSKAITDMFTDFFGESKDKKEQNLSYFQILNGTFDLIQTQLTTVMLKQHQPDVLISIPKNTADTFDFFKAKELIDLGRRKTIEAFDKLEKDTKNK